MVRCAVLSSFKDVQLANGCLPLVGFGSSEMGQASLLKANSRDFKPIVHYILMCRSLRGKNASLRALKVSNGVKANS